LRGCIELVAAKLAAVRQHEIRRLIINLPPRHAKSLLASVGGVLTGRGADLIVIDDPLKPEEALSQAQRQAANEWFDHTLYSRLNDKRSGAIVLIMHRPHEDDLTGHVLAQKAWELLALPALAEADECHALEHFWGREPTVRRRGEALQPEREGVAVLGQIRRTVGEYNFAGQYQQAPAPLGGGLVKPAWFARYRSAELPERFERIVQSWDTANKATELADFSVCTSWGIAGKHLYLLDLVRERFDYPELKRRVKDEHRRWRADVVLIEDKASGTQLIPEPLDEGMHAATRYRPQTDKITRIYAQTAVPGLDPGIENGFVHLPETAPWLALYLYELLCFPYGRHDDQVPPDTLFRGRPRRCSTGSRRPGAKTASSPIAACSPKSAAARHAAERTD
jgi:predicted phage terminase large subunit-like protein